MPEPKWIRAFASHLCVNRSQPGDVARSVIFVMYPSSPEDRKLHRSFHDKYIRPRIPKVDARLARFPLGDVRVDAASPKWLHRLVYDRARALAREEHYDFAQWGEESAPFSDQWDRKIHALLLIEDQRVTGTASFCYRKWSNYPEGHEKYADNGQGARIIDAGYPDTLRPSNAPGEPPRGPRRGV